MSDDHHCTVRIEVDSGPAEGVYELEGRLEDLVLSNDWDRRRTSGDRPDEWTLMGQSVSIDLLKEADE